jgi:hypothetical protein
MPLFQPMIPSATPTPNAVYARLQALEISSRRVRQFAASREQYVDRVSSPRRFFQADLGFSGWFAET